MFIDKQFRLGRIWSNEIIRKIAPLFHGDIVNISGWNDYDKEGEYYKNYFINARSYTITNYTGVRGFVGNDNEIFLDLSADVPNELIAKFDVCFNHTTLEHIFDVHKAFSTICAMSRDIVLVVVPFSQIEHETESYRDYWRFTASCMRQLFEENGMDVIYEAQSPYRNAATYLLFVGSKHPNSWRNKLPDYEYIKDSGSWIGKSLRRRFINIFKKK